MNERRQERRSVRSQAPEVCPANLPSSSQLASRRHRNRGPGRSGPTSPEQQLYLTRHVLGRDALGRSPGVMFEAEGSRHLTAPPGVSLTCCRNLNQCLTRLSPGEQQMIASTVDPGLHPVAGRDDQASASADPSPDLDAGSEQVDPAAGFKSGASAQIPSKPGRGQVTGRG